MEKLKIRKKPKKPYVFQFFEIIVGKKENGATFKKVICKFCQWRSVMNTTRMVSHIRRSCNKCSPESKNLILQYYGNGPEKAKSDSRITYGSITTKSISPSKNENYPDEQKTFLKNYENRELNSTPHFDDWNSTIELFRRIGHIPSISNIDVSRNEIKPQINMSIKYEDHDVSDTVDITSEPDEQNDNNFTADNEYSKLYNVPKIEDENENHQPDVKAFSEFVYHEFQTIKDLEIVNELKHDICNLLYTAKKQYLQNKRK